MNKESLLAFEDEVRTEFQAGKITHPVHFSKGNEEKVIGAFADVKSEDWVFSTHRSHYHALLKGIPPEWIKDAIRRGCSMHLMNAEHRFFASAIVCGSVPIALGVALGIKLKGGKERVWCFVGDMAAEMGFFHEATKYAWGHRLPITFITEDNGLSTTTPTQETWGMKHGGLAFAPMWYEYIRGCPHINTETWVEFK